MDEVEAALDDTNLRRLIGLFEQLREKSQLIVITHQKPTMEVADALYGVSMRATASPPSSRSACAVRTWLPGEPGTVIHVRAPRTTPPNYMGEHR